MYRDDPLDDEQELRDLLGDDLVDLIAHGPAGEGAVAAAVDALRILQGWTSDDEASAWFTRIQQRLGEERPVDRLAAGAVEDVLDAARAWAAAQG